LKTVRGRIIPIFVPHLGCPHGCVFCNQRHITGEQRVPTADDVRRTVEEALAKSGAGAQVAFYGGSFTAVDKPLQVSLLGAVQPYLQAGTVSGIRLSTRPDAIDGEELRLLRQYGVTTVELGAQSMDDGVLTLSQRGHTAGQVELASRLVKEQGFSLILQMMTGLPGDTREKANRTARRIAAQRPDGVRIYPTVIVRNTALARMWRSGTYREHTPREAALWCADLIEIFEEANIPILRLGLNPTEALSAGEALGGAYHPAMGELARGEYWLRKIEAALPDPLPKTLTVTVPRGMVSMVTGHKRCNITLLKQHYGFSHVKVREDAAASQLYLLP